MKRGRPLWGAPAVSGCTMTGLSHRPAIAIHKGLLVAPRGVVDFGGLVDLLELGSELLVNALGAVAHDRKPAASVGPRESKRPDDDVSVRFQGMADRRDVARARRLVGEEVK